MAKRRGHGEGVIVKQKICTECKKISSAANEDKLKICHNTECKAPLPKEGRWMGQLTTGYNDQGKQKRRSFYGKTRKEVVDKMDQVKKDLSAGILVEPHKVTLGEWLDRWLAAYQKPAVSPSTYELRGMLIRVHIKPELGRAQLTKLKPADLQDLYTKKLETGRTDSKSHVAQVSVKGRESTFYGKAPKDVQEKAKKALGDQYDEALVKPVRLGLSSQTVRHIHNILHGALKQAMKEGLVSRNVAQATSPPKVVRGEEMRTLSRDEVGQFLNAVEGERLEAAFLLDLAAGLRRGEVLGVRWSDLDLEKGTLQVRKSLSRLKQDDGTTRLELGDVKTPKSRRLIPLPDEVVQELKAHRARQNQEKLRLGEAYQDEGLVFATAFGGRIEPRNLHRAWTRVLKKAGIEHTRFHNLRHTFATMLLEMGEHPKVVQEMLGHSKVSMTLDTYSHIVPGLKEKAAAKLNDVFKSAKGARGAR